MCQGCYEEYGSPRIVNATTIAAAALIERVFEFSCVGGNLHIAVDDWNLGDDNIDSCARFIEEDVLDGGDEQQIAVERACLTALRMLTVDERASALAIHDGFIGSAPTTQT